MRFWVISSEHPTESVGAIYAAVKHSADTLLQDIPCLVYVLLHEESVYLVDMYLKVAALTCCIHLTLRLEG